MGQPADRRKIKALRVRVVLRGVEDSCRSTVFWRAEVRSNMPYGLKYSG